MSELQAFFDRLDGYIPRRMEVRRTPGAALALFDRERTVRASTYGVSNLETQTLVAPDTLFGIGSITKTFTAVAVLQAAESGRLDLQAPVTDYLPWFEVQSRFAPITLHHLLAHSAGIVGCIDRSPDTRAAAWALRETETAWPPGTQFYYSDAGYQVLALVLEAVIGLPFQEILRTKLLEPLGMADSEPAFTHAMRPRTATGYRTLYDDRPSHASYPLVPAAWIEMNAGDCCIASTAEDLARFARLLLNRGQGPERALLSEASYERLIQEPMSTEYGFEYGYGIEVHRRDEIAHLGHGGGMPAYEAFMLIDVDHGLGVTLLSTKPSIDVRDLAWTVMTMWRKAYYGESLEAVDLSLPDPTQVENAADYAGTYRGEGETLTFSAEGRRLALRLSDGCHLDLERHGEDAFYVPHPGLERFLLRFERAAAGQENQDTAVGVCHGGDWYAGEHYAGPQAFEHPAAWDAYPGHYRSHIPWQTNFRVVLRKGGLWLVWPAGSEEPLTPVGEGVFRIGDETSPERLRFSQSVDGQALCATLSGDDYYRFFVP